MTFTAKPTRRFLNPSSSTTGISTVPKQPSTTASSYCGKCRTRTRFLLKCTATQLWLADNSLVDDKSELYTLDPINALAFITPEGASQRARQLLHLIADLTVEAVEVPLRHG